MNRALVLLVASVCLVPACGGSSTPSPTVSGLTVTGTSALANKNATSQLTATVRMSNNTTQDVTTTSTWASSNATVASVSASGLVTALANGNSSITATYSGTSGSLAFSVAMKATPEVTPWFSRLCGPYRARMLVTFKETSRNIGYNITALTIVMRDYKGVVRYNKSFTTAEITALMGSNHLNAGETRALTVDQAYPGNVDTEDSKADVTATIVDEAGNTTAVNLTGLFQHDGC